MQLDALIRALAPSEVTGATPVEIADLAYDTRGVSAGGLFFCVQGERVDGHDLAWEAIERGAVALVVERQLDVDVPQLLVPSVRESMAVAADAFFGEPTKELELAGVTGTNGKTTTTFLLHAILQAAGRQAGLVGTVEWRVGGERRAAPFTTPEAIDLQRLFREMLDAGDRSAAVEASSHGAALRRLDRVRFDALVFTNLSQDHLDLHGTMEDYFQAKRRLFTRAQPPPAAVNVGTEWGRQLAVDLRDLHRAPLVTFGLDDGAEIHPEGLEVTSAGSTFRAGGIEIETPLRGLFNVENALGAVAAGLLLDLEDDAIAEGIASVTEVAGRFEAIDEGQPFAVVVDYAHTPDSLATVLEAARGLGPGRVIVVFGAGGDRDRRKRPLMGKVAVDLADVTIVTSDNPRSETPLSIIQDVLQGTGVDVEIDPDRRSAIARAISLAEEGDVVVIAGKGHEQGQDVAGVVTPFDDREVAREALRGLGVIPLDWQEIAELELGALEGGGPGSVVTRISADSREVGRGDLFVALNTGVRFVEDARARGAMTLLPDDQESALAAVASLVRSKSDAQVVAVVGSAGKTTTKDILGALCAPLVSTIWAERSLNNEIGLPLTVCRLEPDTRVLVTEMGMRGLGQVAALCEIARPHVVVIPHVGPEHLELLGSVERVAEANAEAIAALPSGGTAVVPAHAAVLEPYLGRADVTFRRFAPADVATIGDQTRFSLDGTTVELELPFTQRHLALNALAALHAYAALGLALERAAEGVEDIRLSPWRGEVTQLPGGGFVVNDAYNANPDSMRAALEHLAERADDRRRIAILGEMAELGAASETYHREIGALAASLGVEIVGVGEAAHAYEPVAWAATVGDVRELARSIVQPGDAVLVKASRAVGLEGIADDITNFARAWSPS